MLQFSVLGNLAADAEVKQSNGRSFVSFTVYHSEKYTTASGEQRERVQRVSCALNGDGGSLLQYLKRGVKVYVSGRGMTSVFSSPKERAWVAGVNISVDRVELCGGSSDEVPRQLSTPEGLILPVHKAYYIAMVDKEANNVQELLDNHGSRYAVDANGFITQVVTQNDSNDGIF